MSRRIKIQILRTNSANRTSYTPAEGEFIFENDTNNLYIGDGSTAGGILIAGPSSSISTASNVGTAGVGPFKQITSGEIEFRNINAGSAKVSVTLDSANDEIDLDVNEGSIDHDALQNFVTNEHIDHTSVSIIAGNGLTGGGDITADRTLNVDESDVDHDALQNFVADEHIDHSTVNITAGTGLSGGGDITASRTIDITNTGVGSGSYGNATNVPQITVNAQGQITAASNTPISLSSSNITDFDEAAQDAAGALFSDSASIDFTYNDAGNSLTAVVVEGGVNHDALQNFVANEHVDHSSVNINAGTGLTGGGDITTSRTLNLDNTGVSVGSYGSLKSVGVFTVDAQGRITSASDIDIDHDQLTNFLGNEHINHSAVAINAGSGLTGGGDITASRTLSVNESDVDHDALQNFEIDEHRPLDDTSTTTTNLWSGQKIQDELDDKLNETLVLNTQTGNYTVQLSDSASKILMNNGATATVTLPNGFPTGFQVIISRIGTGIVEIATLGTLLSQGTELDLQNTGCVATHIGSNQWIVEGRLV